MGEGEPVPVGKLIVEEGNLVGISLLAGATQGLEGLGGRCGGARPHPPARKLLLQHATVDSPIVHHERAGPGERR